MLVTLLCLWLLEDDNFWISMREYQNWWHLLNVGPLLEKYSVCWWPKTLSQSCHQHISSPTSVTNIDVTPLVLTLNENRLKVLSFTSIMMGVVDLEIHYASHGQMVKPPQPPDFGIPCHFTWNSTVFQNGQNGLIIFSEFLSTVTRTSISIMTIISSALIWWYSELERRLLVIRHHLVEEIGLIRSPLSRHYMFELGLFWKKIGNLRVNKVKMKKEASFVILYALYNMMHAICGILNRSSDINDILSLLALALSKQIETCRPIKTLTLKTRPKF